MSSAPTNVSENLVDLIPDNAISASHEFSSDHEAKFSRKRGSNSWATPIGTQNVWLQWDLGERRLVNKVWSHSLCAAHGVQAYTLTYSENGSTWVEHPGIFCDLPIEGTRDVEPPIFARWVRLNVSKKTQAGDFKAELWGQKSITNATKGALLATPPSRRLKLQHKGDFYRLLLNLNTNGGYDDLAVVVGGAIGQSTNLKITYVDEEGDRCVLNGATFEAFEDFLLNFVKDSVVKLNIEEWSASVYRTLRQDRLPSDEEEEQDILTDRSEDDFVAHVQDDDIMDEGFQVLRGSGHCFLKRTLLPTTDDDFRTVSTLQVGDHVLGSKGQHLEIMYKKVHPKKLYAFTTLRTAAAELTVTVDHRIVVRGSAGGEKPAGELELGDVVICGPKPQRITKIMTFERRADLVEFRFKPDESVATFMTNPCGILTKGGKHPDTPFEFRHSSRFATRPLGPLGPYTIEAVNTKDPHRRTRSCEP